MPRGSGKKPHSTEEQKRRFFYLTMNPRGPKLSTARAAQEVGLSNATGYRLRTGYGQSPKVGGWTLGSEMPEPKELGSLSGDAKEALADFNAFGEMFFALTPMPWRRDASLRIVDAIMDTADRTFLDMNMFPGIGKTTIGKALICWLIAGGGVCEPTVGRQIRIMLGAETVKVARHMLRAVRLPLELRKPYSFFNKRTRVRVSATHTLGVEYGRFKPDPSLGEESLWSQDQILVAQLIDVDLSDKEPTVQIASQESGFLGERIDFAWWDDIATSKNSRNPDTTEMLNRWFEDEAETRVEPGGVLVLVGQRLSPLDLHRKRLDAQVEDHETGSVRPLYRHITYPAHHDALCDGDHRQWDPETSKGCFTDAEAMTIHDWNGVRSKESYRTVYQQEDSDPSKVLVQQVWIEGGIDPDGYNCPGSLDRERSWGEHPKDVGHLIDYAAVDPSVSNWWAAEWWSYQPESRFNYLIWGERRKMQAFQLLGWDNAAQVFTGLMEDWQRASSIAGHPIRVWVIESNAAHRYLVQTSTYRDWCKAWPDVRTISHETQRNKSDDELGVEGILPPRYKTGFKRIPYRSGTGTEGKNFLRTFIKELTTYPYSDTDDTVLADWMGEMNLSKIVQAAKRAPGQQMVADARLPKYLRDHSYEMSMSIGADS